MIGGNPAQYLLTREQAEALLEPYITTLNGCIDEAWGAWKSGYHAQKSHILDARARAAIVYCEIVYRAKAAFSGMADVKVVATGGMLKVHIGDHITLRFKKIGKNGRCSNIMTKQQVLFLAQMQLPGILAGTLVHAGYELDQPQAEIARKAVVCQLDNRVLWQIEVTGTPGELLTMPPVAAPEQPQTGPRFVVKKELEPKANEAQAARE